MDRVRDERMRAPVGDVPGAVRNLVAHYEDRGDMALRWLACPLTRRPVTQSHKFGFIWTAAMPSPYKLKPH